MLEVDQPFPRAVVAPLGEPIAPKANPLVVAAIDLR